MSKRRDTAGFVLLLGWIGVASSCGQEPGPMLHRMTSYAGKLRVTPEGGSAQEFDVTFDRRNGNLQAKLTVGKRVVTLVRGADGKPSAFENAEQRPSTAGEVAHFELVRDLTDGRRIEAVQRGVESYSVRRGGKWFAVELESQTGTRMHGQPR